MPSFGLAGQAASCTLNTDRTRDSAGRKVGLRTTRKGEPPHPAVTNPIPLPRASLSSLVNEAARGTRLQTALQVLQVDILQKILPTPGRNSQRARTATHAQTHNK